MTSRGIVRFWNSEDGWGVIDCEQTPGGCWVHFSEVEVAGFRKLTPGQQVTFEWQKPSGPVEGFAFVAVRGQQVTFEWQKPSGPVEGFAFVAVRVHPVEDE